MAATPNAQYSVAATRVFGTMELLEMILLDVAHAEIDLPESTLSKPRHRNVYIRSPIILRAVNRDFRNTIDGSSQLLRLRLKAVPPQATRGYFDFRSPLSPEDFGPLHWLQEQHRSFAFINQSYIRDGVLRLRLIILDTVLSDREDRMSESVDGSWRELPWSTNWELVSKVELEMYYEVISACRRKSRTFELGSHDLESEPTLGTLFDKFHRTKAAIRTEKEVKAAEMVAMEKKSRSMR